MRLRFNTIIVVEYYYAASRGYNHVAFRFRQKSNINRKIRYDIEQLHTLSIDFSFLNEHPMKSLDSTDYFHFVYYNI